MFQRMKQSNITQHFNKYPCCDHLNVALGFLLEKPEENHFAILEICNAIVKAHGYFFDWIAKELEKNGMPGFVKH